MLFSVLFDPDYCNQLLEEMVKSFPHSVHGPKHMEMEPSSHAARIWSKKFIQMAQIRSALDYVIQYPHLKEGFRRISVLHEPYLQDESFLNEMQSFFTSEYGVDDARNYAISVKEYSDFITRSVHEFMLLNQEIFDTDIQKWKAVQIHAFVKTVQRKIKEFLKRKEEFSLAMFHRLEVYVEKGRFHKLVAILESE